MTESDWLAATRTSYDTVAADYADILRGTLAQEPFQRGLLALFAEWVPRTDAGRAPVCDVGCGPGRLTGYLHEFGLDAFGVDLSPGMIEVARQDHPGVRFEVGSMTALDLPDQSLAGMLSWFSLIHVPDAELPTTLAEFHRVLQPGGVLMIGFHTGEGSRHKTEGYGGHAMDVYVHHRTTAQVAARLQEAGFTIESEMNHHPAPNLHGGFVFAKR